MSYLQTEKGYARTEQRVNDHHIGDTDFLQISAHVMPRSKERVACMCTIQGASSGVIPSGATKVHRNPPEDMAPAELGSCVIVVHDPKDFCATNSREAPTLISALVSHPILSGMDSVT